MRTRVAVLVAAVVASACAPGGLLGPRFVECNSTETCRAQAAERDRKLAAAVAAEPPAKRIDVEAVSDRVLVDRSRKVVYALEKDLVALDLATGNERWRVASGNAPGAAATLTRAGTFLVVASDPGQLPPRVTFVDPDAPARPASCALVVGAPKEAANIVVSTFDRGGQPYAFWRSWWSYHGGTPPGPDADERAKQADACAIVKIDPRTCATSREPFGDFVWMPPEGRRERPGEHGFCGMLSVVRDIPAAAASAPRPSTAKDVRVEAAAEKVSGCQRKIRVTLEAEWHRVLEEYEEEICGPP